MLQIHQHLDTSCERCRGLRVPSIFANEADAAGVVLVRGIVEALCAAGTIHSEPKMPPRGRRVPRASRIPATGLRAPSPERRVGCQSNSLLVFRARCAVLCCGSTARHSSRSARRPPRCGSRSIRNCSSDSVFRESSPSASSCERRSRDGIRARRLIASICLSSVRRSPAGDRSTPR